MAEEKKKVTAAPSEPQAGAGTLPPDFVPGTEPPAQVRKRTPKVEVQSQGRISKHLEYLVKSYEQKNPGRGARWVYSPTHKPELSNVIARRMDGWTEVRVADLPDAKELLGLKGEEDPIRSGDVIMMSNAKEKIAELRQENVDRAKEQVQQVNVKHYKDTQDIQATGPDGETHSVRPRGRSAVEEREINFTYTHKDPEQE